MKMLRVIFISGILTILMFMVLFLIPVNYDVESFNARANTKFWNMTDNSKIGYFKIERSNSSYKSPIIYLHGGPGGIITDKTIEDYKRLSHLGHDIYFYDQIGSGHSDRLNNIEEYTVKRHRKDLEEIIRKIEADKIILIGHSWGSCLAMNYLQHNHHKVEKMVLTGPGPILPINQKLRNKKAPDSLEIIEPQFSNREGNRRASNWKTILVSKFAYAFKIKLASDEEMDDYFTHLNKELIKSTDCTPRLDTKVLGGGGYYSHLMTARDLDYVEDGRGILKALKTPLLIIRGQCDNQKWGYTEEYTDLLVNSELKILKGLGHDVLNSEKKEAISIITEFLER